MSGKPVSIKAVIYSLIDMVGKGTIHFDDTVIFAELLDETPHGREVSDDQTYVRDIPDHDGGCLNLLVRSADPEATYDTDVYIFPKDNKEETNE